MTTNKLKEDKTTIDPGRRQVMGVLGAIGTLGAAGLMGYTNNSTTALTHLPNTEVKDLTSLEASAAANQVLVPSETLGTFPLATILNNSSFLRETISEDKQGIPLTVNLKLIDANDRLTPISAYVYIWHCDHEGLYSGYDAHNNPGQADKTYCRGLQPTDANGQTSFTTIYPGRQEEQITHINFQIFLTGHSGLTSSSAILQMALPDEITAAVYHSDLYSKGQNSFLKTISEDDIFANSAHYQVATVTGNMAEGYVAELVVGVAVA